MIVGLTFPPIAPTLVYPAPRPDSVYDIDDLDLKDLGISDDFDDDLEPLNVSF